MAKKQQYIIICLKNKTEFHQATYVQPTRERFLTRKSAKLTAQALDQARDAIIIPVAPVEIDKNNYPI